MSVDAFAYYYEHRYAFFLFLLISELKRCDIWVSAELILEKPNVSSISYSCKNLSTVLCTLFYLLMSQMTAIRSHGMKNGMQWCSIMVSQWLLAARSFVWRKNSLPERQFSVWRSKVAEKEERKEARDLLQEKDQSPLPLTASLKLPGWAVAHSTPRKSSTLLYHGVWVIWELSLI